MTCLAKFNPVDVFDSFFADAVPAASGKSACWSPRADVVLGADKATIRFDLPGMKKEDIGLKVDDVISRGKNADVFEVRELIKDVFIEGCLVGDGNFSTLHSFDQLVFGSCVVSYYFTQCFQCAPGDVARVCG